MSSGFLPRKAIQLLTKNLGKISEKNDDLDRVISTVIYVPKPTEERFKQARARVNRYIET